MAITTTISTEETETYILQVDSALGPILRTVKRGPPRDARPDEIAIIDISGIYSDDISERRARAAEACLDFFHSSIDNKNKIYFDHEIEGYTGRNNEQINTAESVDVREKFKLYYRPSMDPTSKLPGYPLGGTYQEFPWERTTYVPSFADAMTDCFIARLQLAWRLLRTCALALDLPEDYFDEKVVQPNAVLQVSLGSHTDFGILTILWQDNTGGLQILSPEGEWINAKPIPGTLVCNMGDLMSMITRGRFVSDIHKAKNETAGERISIPFFLGFGPKVPIEVVETCV
ncbi:hypothetical protein GE09DRAFT_1260070 [Coniochaeta sp. 2T2.1]|nr:hypothetical protein GE09DRAFT_1260070 [Coniochaeta sp. 2T2.1]